MQDSDDEDLNDDMDQKIESMLAPKRSVKEVNKPATATPAAAAPSAAAAAAAAGAGLLGAAPTLNPGQRRPALGEGEAGAMSGGCQWAMLHAGDLFPYVQ